MQLTMLFRLNFSIFIFVAEASCAASLKTAQAVVEEAGQWVSPALRKLAKNSESHAESAFHKSVREQGLALDIPLTEFKHDGVSFSVLLLSDWMRFILILGW